MNKQKNVWINTIGGSLGGCVEALTLHPLDTIKTRIQLSGMRGNRTNIPKSVIGCGKHIIKNEGFFSLYKGLSPFVVHLMSKYFLRYFVKNLASSSSIAKKTFCEPPPTLGFITTGKLLILDKSFSCS